MSFRTKKLAVLHQLNQESTPIGLHELLEKLGSNYTERSVRRWLAEMIKEGLIEKLGNKRGTKYKVIQHISHEDIPDSCFSQKSKKILEQIQLPIYERVPITYMDDWFDAYQPNNSFYIPLKLRLQLHKAGKRSTLSVPAGTYAHQIFNRLLIDLSYNSSRLEGNTYSLLDTKKLILEGISPEGKLDEEKTMILNHKEAIRYLVDTAPRLEIDKATICTLHFLLSDGLLEASRHAGKVRDHGVRIGGSVYIPFEDPKQLEIRLDRIIKKAALIKDPYEQSLFLLIHISYLQAFADVNKRTARLSANIPLIKNNLVPLSFSDVERNDYTSAMIAVYELQNIHPILDLYVFSYMRTCVMYDSTVKTINYDEIRVRYRQQRRGIISYIITHNLVGRSMRKYISTQTSKFIKKEDQTSFIEDVMEDLKEINESRIVGLGITKDQLKNWIDLNQVNQKKIT
ncbi:MAG TPA: Fic family protein [Candidatus Rhabdochlamydia sp.]|nr:Fic family protein [Candidatus Rhabdochlamydia sp.]